MLRSFADRPRSDLGEPARTSRLLLPVFLLSGLSSLIYQVVWQRLLSLHYGVGSISITLIVSAYMLGLGLGALLGGQLSQRVRRGLVAYFLLELLLALFGVASLPFLHGLGRLTAGDSYVVSFVSMFLFLLLPTLLMGATLPLLVKIFSRLGRGFTQSVSLLYFANTLGASLGAFVTAYYLISFWGLDRAIYGAAGINLLLAAAVLWLARGVPARDAPRADPFAPGRESGESGMGAWAYPLVFISGFLAIGYELVWFRLIGALIKASPYAFATILSVYLLGIAVGSYALDRFLRRRPDVLPVNLFFLLQFLTGACVVVLVSSFYHLTAWGGFATLVEGYFLQELHPPSLSLYDLGRVFLWPLFFELLPTLLIGASFPLLAYLALSRPGREGVTVGRVSFTNAIGNLMGGVITGFVLLNRFGTEHTLCAFASIHLAMLLFAPGRGRRPWRAAPKLALVASALFVTQLVFPKSGELYRVMWSGPGAGYKRFFEEGVEGVVATFERGHKVRNLINGLHHGYRPNFWFAFQATEAVATAPSVANVLIIGFGTGTITEFVLLSDEVEKATVVEINRTLMKNLRKMHVFERILDDPRLEVVYDDGRRLLAGTDERFDLIMMDPLRTTTAYSNNIFSLEFFELVSRRLEACGVFFVAMDEPQIVPRTVATAFPHLNYYEIGRGDEGFILASECPLTPDHRRVAGIVGRIPAEIPRLAKILRKNPTARPPQLRPIADRDALWRTTTGAPINRDWRPMAEYYLGDRRRQTGPLRANVE